MMILMNRINSLYKKGKAMKILVCVKQVMESESPVRIHDSGKWICPCASARFEMNPFDTYAVEEALRIRERIPGTLVHTITVGPESSRDTLRRALGMGADEAVHILDPGTGYRPPFLTASWIAAYARGKGYDLILTGIMSADEMNGQTGPMIAQRLSIPCASAVLYEKPGPDGTHISIEREIEGGARDMFEVALPCVLTLQTGINSPRYPSLSMVLRARKKEISVIPAGTFDDQQPGIRLHSLYSPQKERKGILLDGTIEEKAEQLMDILAQKALLT
jgi:electron transfer flavoprotein beta subunit